MRKEIVETADAGDVSHSDSDSDGSDGSGRTGGRMAMLGLKKSPARAATVKNRQRVLILSSRGIIHRFRHLMSDLHVLMPHSRKENKLDTKQRLGVINELAELSNCNNALFFEVRKHKDLYMWLAKTPNGPSVKFHVQNSMSFPSPFYPSPSSHHGRDENGRKLLKGLTANPVL